MARGNDESRNPNRQVGPDKWHRMGMLDRTTPEGYLAAGGQERDLYETRLSKFVPEAAYDPDVDHEFEQVPTTAALAKRKAVVYGRPYEVSPGKYGFEWEYRDPDTGEPMSNAKNIASHREMERLEASNASMADSYHDRARDDAAKEHYGLDYNEYRAWKAGEGPEEDYSGKRLYQDPEGWKSWSMDKHYVGEPKGNHLSNVEGTRHRLKDVYDSRNQARRQGRKFLNRKDYFGRRGRHYVYEPDDATGYMSW